MGGRGGGAARFEVRPARAGDAAAMAGLLNGIVAMGGATAHRGRFDAARITETFMAGRFAIGCFAATGAVGLQGFQALEWSDPDWPGDDRLPADWALIATFTAPEARRSGVGRALFAATAAAARDAGVRWIVAAIRRENRAAAAFYAALGFVDWHAGAETISKRFAPG